MIRLLRVVLVAALALLLVVPVATAAEPSIPDTGRVLVSTGGDVVLPAGERADVVVVVGGTATLSGDVDTVVAVDGRAVLSGATVETIVAVRSPVDIGAGSTVKGDVVRVDSVVTRSGDAVVGASVRGLAVDLAGIRFFLGPLVGLIFFGFALAAIAAGLLLAGLAGRQVRAAGELISQRPWQTLAVGVVGLFLPAIVATALFVTVVGAPLAIGLLFGLWPAVGFLGYLVTGIWMGDLLLARSGDRARERPYLAAVVGLVVLQVLAFVPVVPFVASLFGYGAVLLLAWRTLAGTRTGTEGRGIAQSAALAMPS